MNVNVDDNPLVSIVIVTYNSSRFVLETLECAKQQTYQNIELIVSDDCSSDNTVKICGDWLKENKSRFNRTELLTVEKNTGIPYNCNRGLNVTKGKFLKFIAGDDVILPEFIGKCLEFFQKDNEIAVTYTKSRIIDESSNFVRNLPNKKYKSGYIFKELFFVEFWPASPSFMFKRECVFEVGGFDENIAVEDYLLLLKLARKHKIQFVNNYLTYYRIHSSNTSKNLGFIYKEHLKTINEFKEYEGYNKRITQLNTTLINSYSRTNKKIALQLILKNLNSISINVVWLKIFVRLIIPGRIHSWAAKLKMFSIQYRNKKIQNYPSFNGLKPDIM